MGFGAFMRRTFQKIKRGINTVIHIPQRIGKSFKTEFQKIVKGVEGVAHNIKTGISHEITVIGKGINSAETKIGNVINGVVHTGEKVVNTVYSDVKSLGKGVGGFVGRESDKVITSASGLVDSVGKTIQSPIFLIGAAAIGFVLLQKRT